MELTADIVTTIFESCEAEGGGPSSMTIKSIGRSTLNRTELEKHRGTISALLDELPEGFHEATGGGWSFLNACNDKHGRQWTGLHATMLRLFRLGIGIGRVRELSLPGGLGAMMPGGMPYYVVTTGGDTDAAQAEVSGVEGSTDA